MGIVRVQGTLDLTKFWPTGSSDADTTKLLVRVESGTFKYAGTEGGQYRKTTVFDGAQVAGRAGYQDTVKDGVLTLRLEGVDAPELHYRPSAALKKRPANPKPGVVYQTAAQHKKFLDVNHEYRQNLAESATVSLSQFLSDVGPNPIKCEVRSVATQPNDVFDTYGRFVGQLYVKWQGREVCVNDWLISAGWAVPSFYNQMPVEDIQRLTDLANEAYNRDLGIWSYLSDSLGTIDMHCLYRGKTAMRGETFELNEDAGTLIPPKFFRRLVTFTANKKAGMLSGSFTKYLADAKSDIAMRTEDFLLQGEAAPVSTLDQFINDGVLMVWPEELVYRESPSTLRPRPGQPLEW